MGTVDKAICVEHLTFGYGRDHMLEDVTFEVPSSGFTVLMGRNGSGKSTLLRIVAGLLPYREGNITLHQKELAALSFPQRAGMVAFLPQKHKPVFPFTVNEVVLTGRASYIGYLPKEEDLNQAHLAIEKAGIGHLKSRIYTALSGGEQQLVMIARTMAQQSRIFLLDEPVSHLDYRNQMVVINLLKQLVREGKTVVAVLHDPNLAFLYGDHFLYVHKKKVLPERSAKPWENPILREILHENIHAIPYKDKGIVMPDF